MSLEYKVESLDGLDDSVQSLYVQVDDGYVLDVQGAADPSEVERLRSHNSKLIGEKRALAEQYADVDIEMWNEFKQSARTAEEDRARQEQDIDRLLELRSSEMKKEFETKLTERENKLNATTKELRELKIDGAIMRAANEVGVKPNAVDDVLLHGRTSFDLEDGKVVSKDKEGNVRFNASNEPYSISEFVQDLVKEKPYLLEESTGGGAHNNSGGNPPAIRKLKRSDPNYSRLFAKHNKEIASGKIKIVD